MNDLLRKLKESGIVKKTSQLENTSPISKLRFADVFTGNWEIHDSGEVFVIHETFPFGYLHGDIAFSGNLTYGELLSFEGFPSDFKDDARNIAFFDIETSSLSFGAGSFVFLIGLCYFSSSGIETDLLIIDHPAAEKALLEEFNKRLCRFKVVASYNGKSFDAPFIRNRNTLHQLEDVLGQKHHIDLLVYSRRLWKLRLDSCKLSNIEHNILGLRREEKEIPGWLVPQVYFDYLNQKDPHMLEGVLYHNKIDVISLAALFQHILRILETTGGVEQLNALDYYSLAKLYEKNGGLFQAKYYYALYFQETNNESNHKHIQFEYGMLLKRLGNYQSAIPFWESSGEEGVINSCIELSKFFEHKLGEFSNALKWAFKAREMAEKQVSTSNKESKIISDIDHRIKRINRKYKNEK